MSSVSSLGSSQYTYSSPLQQLEAELQSEVSAGTVSSSDESALSSALTSINSSLTADQSSSGSQAAGGTGDNGPGDIKSKINSLIQAQVSSGALTSDQATELQNLFSNTFGNGPGGSGGQGGPGGPSGPLPLAHLLDRNDPNLRQWAHCSLDGPFVQHVKGGGSVLIWNCRRRWCRQR